MFTQTLDLKVSIIFSILTIGYVYAVLSPARLQEGTSLANNAFIMFIEVLQDCIDTSMPNQPFYENIQKHVNFPAKTTVGLAPRFTSNRKFFANMLTATEFKEMLAKDEETLRGNYITKIKYCDENILTEELLKESYDREVDQSKL